jgi:hypothetical protein
MQPQRLEVPLFQRPYVWSEERQWEPLWEDVVRVAERQLAAPQEVHQPHFLGAVVLQQMAGQTGHMQQRTIIDGQQRLTTLQFLLDALHAELLGVGATPQAMRIEALVANAEAFRASPHDQFKVWPTNRDRPAFEAVMGAEPPVDYAGMPEKGERIVEGHRFFAERAREWLRAGGEEELAARAAAIELTAREKLQIVVIDLAADENAQEIFETLNARGAPLTAADLVKNFVFQRLLESDADVEAQYEEHWREFETAFWEKEVSVGRLRFPRSSIFLNHWLVARTEDEVVAREVFDRFKRYADHESGQPMGELLVRVHDASWVYRKFIESASAEGSVLDRLSLFAYRTSVLESEVIKPLVLFLLERSEALVPKEQLDKALAVIESWMVRRMLVRATTKGYSRFLPDLIRYVREQGRERVGDVVESLLLEQTSDATYWPDDRDVRAELSQLLVYRRLRRGRLRMVLEAIEDHLRGWVAGQDGFGGERAARGQWNIEHVMPRKWVTNWPLEGGPESSLERDAAVHRLGNLTLLTSKLNSKVSNGPWTGASGKRAALEQHDVLLLNRELLKNSSQRWGEDQIQARTQRMTDAILEVWPVPEGHSSGSGRTLLRKRARVGVADLMQEGLLEKGAVLRARRTQHRQIDVVVCADGSLEIDGQAYSSPSDAAKAITGKPTNGWHFFLVDVPEKLSLKDVRTEYLGRLEAEGDDDEVKD